MENLNTPRKRVRVTKENIQRTEKSQYAKALVRKAGKAMAPYGAEHVASATIHFYLAGGDKKQVLVSLETVHRFQIVTHLDLGEIPEQFADAGWKQLGDDLMIQYGRKPKRERT